MCIGDNNAAHAADYLNDQLGSLWRISTECARSNTPGLKPDSDQQHSSALAEWHFGQQAGSILSSSQELMFHAQFGRPTLDFLCNHEASLKLDVASGHYNSDYTRASDLVAANSAQNVAISPLKVEFRVPFTMNVIDGQFMNAKQEVNLFVFEFGKAQMVSATSSGLEIDGPSRDAMRFYLVQYLHFLENTRHNVYYSLPTFGLGEHNSLLIDFSSLVSSLPDIPEVHGVPTAYIAKTLTRTWLKTAMLASGSQNLQPSDYGAVSLAEYRSPWSIHDGGLRFHVRFNPPEIKPLCRDEVVLSLIVDEVSFYSTDDFDVGPSHTFKGWKIALLLNLTHVKERDDFNARFELDFGSCQVLKQFSEFDSEWYDEGNAGHVQCQTRLLNFVTGEYLNILESMSYHIVYRYDTRFPGSPGGLDKDEDIEAINPRSDDSEEFKSSVPWSGLGTDTSFCGFDVVSAFSQSSINRFFGWQCSTSSDSILVRWQHEDYCGVTFKPPAIRLLGGSRAIIYISLETGFLKPFRNWELWEEGDKLEFADWRLAFEVDLTMTTHQDIPGISPEWYLEFTRTPAYTNHGAAEKDFRHICVDLSAAKFVHESSRFDGLATTQCRSAVDYLHAIVKYIRDFYFVNMSSSGYHILHTIPIWSTPHITDDPASFLRITDVTHYVVTKEVAQTMQQTTQATESSIVVLGVTDGRPLPSTLPRSGWLARVGSSGTVAVPSDVILEKILLRLLSVVNAKTTLVPRFSATGEWDLQIDAWPEYTGIPSFTFESARDGVRQYKWEQKDIYKREHQGNQNTYLAVNCTTENYVEIPTSFKYGGMEIKLRGHTVFSKKHHDQNLSSHEEANWTASVILRTDASGLHVEVTGGFVDFFPQAPGYVSPTYQTDTSLRSHLPERIDLDGVVVAFKMFEGTWSSCYPGGASYCLMNPVFSNSGDFLCELRAPWQSYTATVVTSPTSPTSLRCPFRRGRQGVTRHTSNTESKSREETELRSVHAMNSRSLSHSVHGLPTHGYNATSTLSETFRDGTDATLVNSHAKYYTTDSQSRESSQAPPLRPYDAFANARATPHAHANRPLLGVRTNPPSRVGSPLSPHSQRYSGTTVHSQQYANHGSFGGYQPPPGPPPTIPAHASRTAPAQHPSSYPNFTSNPRTRSHTPRISPGAGASETMYGGQGYLTAHYTQQRVVSQEHITPQRTSPSQPFGYYTTQQVYAPPEVKVTQAWN